MGAVHRQTLGDRPADTLEKLKPENPLSFTSLFLRVRRSWVYALACVGTAEADCHTCSGRGRTFPGKGSRGSLRLDCKSMRRSCFFFVDFLSGSDFAVAVRFTVSSVARPLPGGLGPGRPRVSCRRAELQLLRWKIPPEEGGEVGASAAELAGSCDTNESPL